MLYYNYSPSPKMLISNDGVGGTRKLFTSSKKKKHSLLAKAALLLCVVFTSISAARAQWDVVINNNTYGNISGSQITVTSAGTHNLFIGPNAVINITGGGQMVINANLIYISAAAKISTDATSSIVIQPSSGNTDPIWIDANGCHTNANWVVNSPTGIAFVDMSGGMLASGYYSIGVPTSVSFFASYGDSTANANFRTSKSIAFTDTTPGSIIYINQNLGNGSGLTFINGTVSGSNQMNMFGSEINNDIIFDSVNLSGAPHGLVGYGPSGYVVTNNGLGNIITDKLNPAEPSNGTSGGHVVAYFVPAGTYGGNTATLPASFIFPVSVNATGDYTPAQVTTSVPNGIHVTVQDFAHSTPNPQTNAGMNRVWNIFADNATTGEYTINLQHNDATNQSNFQDANSYVTQWSNKAPNTSGTYTGPISPAQLWQSNLQTTVYTGNLQSSGADIAGSSMTASNGATNYTLLATSVADSTAYFSKASALYDPLPISLTTFNAYKKDNTALLGWTTASEINSKGFGIQRSTDSKTWSAIGFVNSQAANGNSSAALSYSYTDNNPANGINYYRLQEEGLSGNTAYSSVASVDFGVKATVYPNPASTQLNVTVTANSNYQLINILGKTVSEGSLNAGSNIIGVSNVPSGTYLLRLSANGSASTYKVLIER